MAPYSLLVTRLQVSEQRALWVHRGGVPPNVPEAVGAAWRARPAVTFCVPVPAVGPVPVPGPPAPGGQGVPGSVRFPSPVSAGREAWSPPGEEGRHRFLLFEDCTPFPRRVSFHFSR